MAGAHATAPFVADDLLWARDAYGTAHIEIDPWGNFVVSPARPQHEVAVSQLVRTLHLSLDGTGAGIFTGLGFYAPGGSGYLNVPDALVLPSLRTVDDHDHLLDRPLLVVEVASPSTRTIDRTRKADDYRIACAETYLLVDLPALVGVDEPTLEVRGAGSQPLVSTSPITIVIAGRDVEIDPAALGG